MPGTKFTFDDSQITPAMVNLAKEILKVADADDKATATIEANTMKKVKATSMYTEETKKAGDAARRLDAERKNESEAVKKMAKDYNVLGLNVTKLNRKTRDMLVSIKARLTGRRKLTIAQKKAIIESRKLQAEMKQEIANTTIFGTNLGQLGRTYQAIIKFTNGWIARLGVLRLAILSTGIGALIIAITSLISYFTKTIEGADLLARKMAALRSIVANVVDVFINVGGRIVEAFKNPGEAIKSFGRLLRDQIMNRLAAIPKVINSVSMAFVKFFKRDFKGALDSAQDALEGVQQAVTGLTPDQMNELAEGAKEFAKELRDDAIAADQLTLARQRLRDAERDLRVETAKTRAEIKDLNKDAENTELAAGKRREAARKAFELEVGLLEKREALAQRNVDIIKAENALATSGLEDLQRQADAEERLQMIRTESLELQTTLQNKLNIINQQELARLDKIRQGYVGLKEAIDESLLAIEFENATPLGKLLIKERELKKEYEKELAELKKAIEDNLAIKAITQEEADKTIADFIAAHEDAANKLKKEIEVAKLTVPPLDRKTIGERVVEFREALDKAFNQVDAFDPEGRTIGENIEIWTDEQIVAAGVKAMDNLITWAGSTQAPQVAGESVGEKIKGGMQSALDDLSDLLGTEAWAGFQQGFQAVFDLFMSGVEDQLNAIDELIAKQDEQIAELESQQDKEKELKDLGLSNNLGRIENEIAAEKEKREKALAERDAIEKKAAKAQVINDILQQSSSLTTAAAQIFKAFSSIPFVGVPLAVAAIAAMFAAFAKARLDANKASQQQRLYRGAGRIGDHFDGFVGPKTDRDGGPGYTVHDGETGRPTGVIIGGDEGLIPARVAQPNRETINDMVRNPDKWERINIAERIRKANKYDQLIQRVPKWAQVDTAALARGINLNTPDVRIMEKGVNTTWNIHRTQPDGSAAIAKAINRWISHEKRKKKVSYHGNKPRFKVTDHNGHIKTEEIKGK